MAQKAQKAQRLDRIGSGHYMHKTKTDFEEEKTILQKHAEKEEKQLGSVKEELNTLKRHITSMTAVIFGRRIDNGFQLPIVKLKAAYAYLEQLYTCCVYVIMAVKNAATPSPWIKYILDDLSTVPQRF